MTRSDSLANSNFMFYEQLNKQTETDYSVYGGNVYGWMCFDILESRLSEAVVYQYWRIIPNNYIPKWWDTVAVDEQK